jgi:hypothetical protein
MNFNEQFLLPVCRLGWFLYTLNIYAHFSKNQYQNVKINGIMFIMKNFTGQKFEIFLKDWTSVIKLKNSNGNAPITLYMFNAYKNQQSRQTGSRNLMGPKTLPTIWGTYMKHVTKYQISAINSC